MKGWLIAALLPALATAATSLSDTDLRAYAASPYDKRAKMFHHEVVGVYRGTQVVADFPCSDLCPDETIRIIHFDVAPGADCDRIGGRTVTRTVPYGIGVTHKAFCVPAVLADKPTV